MSLDQQQQHDSWADLAHVVAREDNPREPSDDDDPTRSLDGSEPAWTRMLQPGGGFVLDAAEDPEPLWGRGDRVLLAHGEALMIAGGQGSGKSTLGQQLALGRAGISGYSRLLGYPITPGSGRVLYLAMDRPQQIARSLRRMVDEDSRADLDQRLVVWGGPPPYDMAKYPGLLADMAARVGADTVIVDSLKDASVKLTDDEVGAGWNRARQLALRNGVQVVELHHNRKRQQHAKQTPGHSLDDVYGSTWLTSGAGSVVLLAGDPGDLVVTLHHLKQPADPVGPLTVIHDHTTGRSAVRERTDLVATASAAALGITPRQAAEVREETDKPSPAQIQRARRDLERAVEDGRLRLLTEGNQAAGEARRYGRP